MQDNLQATVEGVFALPDIEVIDLQGAHAAAFAQAQFMNDVATLEPGHWHWNGWLTPKGRVLALFALAKRDEENLRLVVLDAPAAPLAAELRRFVFRSKVTISVTDAQATGQFARPDVARAGQFADASVDEPMEFDLGGDAGDRVLRVGAGQMLVAATATDSTPTSDPAAQQWRAFDLMHGLPRMVPGQLAQWTPQQLSLERLRAFSVKKGCYPGQEIVARTHFLGKAKRGLGLFACDRPLQPGGSLHEGERQVGTVVSSADQGDTHLALAVLPLQREASPLTSGEQRVRELPLQGGLER